MSIVGVENFQIFLPQLFIQICLYDSNGYIQGLSVHLDNPFNNNSDIWFFSNNKINGTNAA